ncbi:hypothetical protein V8E51_012746 [Hyaloscypha variabilis]
MPGILPMKIIRLGDAVESDLEPAYVIGLGERVQLKKEWFQPNNRGVAFHHIHLAINEPTASKSILEEKEVEPGRLELQIHNIEKAEDAAFSLKLLFCTSQVAREPLLRKFPFSKETLQVLSRQWHLPALFLPPAFPASSLISLTKPDGLPDGNFSSLFMSTEEQAHMPFSLCVSKVLSKNMISVLIIGLSQKQREFISSQLRGLEEVSLVKNELLIPLLVLITNYKSLSHDISKFSPRMLEIGTETGIYRKLAVDPRRGKHLDLDEAILELTTIADHIHFALCKLKTLNRFVTVIKNLVVKKSKNGEITPEYIRTRLAYLQTAISGMFDLLTYNQQKQQSLVQTITSLTAQNDNRLNIQIAEDSRRTAAQSNAMAIASQIESINMRLIAVVTLIFLPATCTATLFSTSFFSFQNPAQPKVVSAWIWLYVVITVSLMVALGFTWRWLIRSDKRLSNLQKTQVEMEKKCSNHFPIPKSAVALANLI